MLTTLGDVDEATRRFERLLRYGSEHGLCSEQVDPATATALNVSRATRPKPLSEL